MTKITFHLIVISLAVFIICSGCQAVAEITSIPTEIITQTYLTNDGITLGANLNCPDINSFGFIDEIMPTNLNLVSTPVHFEWRYWPVGLTTNDWSTECVPTSFTLHVAAGPYFDVVNTYSINPGLVENHSNYLAYQYIFSEPLQPHTTYRWMVVGHADTIDIGQDDISLFQDEVSWRVNTSNTYLNSRFRTGPLCDPQTIESPTLLMPAHGTILDTVTPLFIWDMPNCTSEAFRIEIDSDPNIDINHFPTTYWGATTQFERALIPDGVLVACTKYYWRVSAGLYSAAYHQSNGEWAATSETRSFFIRSAACPNVIADPTPTLLDVPTLLPTTSPTLTPEPADDPTDVPEPTAVVCEGLSQPECQAHNDVCQWVVIVLPGSCKDR
ncbi:hypothetical protein ACFLXB_04060 [Chloroflexota bacterium]